MHHAALVIVLISSLSACCSQAESPAKSSIAPVTGSITGTIRFLGNLKPPRPPVPRPTCDGKPIDPARLETLLLGEGRTMAGVYVAVKSGLGGRAFHAPAEPAILKHVGCIYEPRVLAVMAGQPIIARSLDKEMHAVHLSPTVNPVFGRPQPTKGVEFEVLFSLPELAIPAKCDVHPWERAWIHVSDHPYSAVTRSDGKYSIKELPPGDYEILAWHERFRHSQLVAKVTVVAGMTSILDFTFEGQDP